MIVKQTGWFLLASMLSLILVACGRSGTPTPPPTEAAAATVTPAPAVEPVSVGEFSIHLTAQEVPTWQLSQADLDSLELEKQPILPSDDILRYSEDTHEIDLTPSAYERINQLSVPTDGRGFVVSVGSERVYSGAFWTMLSSQSFDGVAIWVPLMDKHAIQMKLGYPGPFDFRGEDPRSDPRILRSLEQAGKLE